MTLTLILKKIKNPWWQRDPSRDYFKPVVGSLGKSVSILYLTALSNWMTGLGAPFSDLYQKWRSLDYNFGKKNSANIFNHKEDTLGIIFSPIRLMVWILIGFVYGMLGSGPPFSAFIIIQGLFHLEFKKKFLETSLTTKRILQGLL